MYAIDFHVHSNFSADSVMKVEKIIDVARKTGLNGVAITDHNTIAGGLYGAKLNKSPDFDVVCGCEMDSEEGHILGLFLNDEIRTNRAFEIVDEIRDQGGLSVLAHPFKHKNEINKELLKKIDCVEVFNSRLSQSNNLSAYQLAKDLDMPLVVGSDAHFYFEIGNAMVRINDCICDSEDLKKSIVRGNVELYGKLTSSPSHVFSKFLFMVRTKVSSRLVNRLL